MAIKTFGEIRQEIAENLGIIDANGDSAFDNTTAPTLNRVNQYINDALREVVSDFPYSQLEKNVWMPFFHTIDSVPAAFLTGTSISPNAGAASWGTVVPFPNGDALKAGKYILPPNFNWAGIAFSGSSILGTQSAVSTTGYQTTATFSGVGYFYELPNYVDSITTITIPDKGVKLQHVPIYDLNRYMPQGIWSTSGTTPTWYTELPGLSPNGNKVIEFFPMPSQALASGNFLLEYKNKQIDLTVSTDKQNILPDQFQNITVHAALNKCYVFLNDINKAQYHDSEKTKLTFMLRKWSENQPDYVNRYRDGEYLSSANMATGADLAVGYMVNGFGN